MCDHGTVAIIRNRKHLGEWGWLYGLIAAASVGIFVWVSSSAMEARAFERATGRPVSVFDAMFLRLRVQAAASTAEGGDR